MFAPFIRSFMREVSQKEGWGIKIPIIRGVYNEILGLLPQPSVGPKGLPETEALFGILCLQSR